VNEFEDRLAAVARAQSQLLELVHRATLDVMAARKRVLGRIEELEESDRRIVEQHDAAVEAGEEQADLLADQSARTRERIRELRYDLDGLVGAEDLLSERAALMQDQIADLRNTMALVSAKVIAARTSAVAGEALDTLRDALTYIEFVVAESKQAESKSSGNDRRKVIFTTATPPPRTGPNRPEQSE
jgi:hypothetical protein